MKNLIIMALFAFGTLTATAQKSTSPENIVKTSKETHLSIVPDGYSLQYANENVATYKNAKEQTIEFLFDKSNFVSVSFTDPRAFFNAFNYGMDEIEIKNTGQKVKLYAYRGLLLGKTQNAFGKDVYKLYSSKYVESRT